MSKLNKKLASIFILISLLFFSAIPGASAFGDLADISAPSAMNDVMSDLGVDKDELKYHIQTFNVSRRKKQQPQVQINFDPANPAPGRKVTAVATPLYFMNDSEDLYFTWYLKPAICPDEREPNVTGEKKEKCDLNGDGDATIEDYKIKAMRTLANNDFEWEKESYSSDSDGDGYKAIWGGDDQGGKEEYCFIHNIDSGDEYEIECDQHLFPNMDSDSDIEAGDGSFGVSEEEFWRTNPHDPDTADTGNGDEANVIGLGMTSFSWFYEAGDEIGVVVEGVSVEPTQEEDSSYRTMWALVNNKCETGGDDTDYPKTDITGPTTEDAGDCVDGFGTKTGDTNRQTTIEKEEFIVSNAANIATIRTKYTTTVRTDADCDGQYSAGETVVTITASCPGGDLDNGDAHPDINGATCSGIDVPENLGGEFTSEDIKKASDINGCLYSNLIDPMDGGGIAEKMEVNLSYLPEFPINDTSDNKDGDQLVVHSTVTNAMNTGYLNYKWEVFENDEPNPDSWGDAILKSDLPDATQTQGMGLDSFKFNLNREDQKDYLKVKLTVTENVTSGVKREGHSSVVIPVSSTSERIKLYSADVSSDSALNLSLADTERCVSGFEKAMCPVFKNEIIGVNIEGDGLTDFFWTLNGEPILPYNKEYQASDTAFFPVLSNPGEEYTLTLAATDQDSGQKVNLTRALFVAEPRAEIVSTSSDTCKPVLLGNYVNLDGELSADYSENNFLALTGYPITLKADFSGLNISPDNFNWYVNGYLINRYNAEYYAFNVSDEGILTLPDGELDQTYAVSISALYSPNNSVKKALQKYWGVTYGDFYEKTITNSVEIKMIDFMPQEMATAQTSPRKILASMYLAVPEYLAFLLRIVLTGFLILFSSRFILSFFPNINRNEI
ncbi:MAG: hypothetical protein QG620_169 [Patescibacteria group bacterium]|nr:hypothetical protein [Patescibacteria group bacterium]